MKRAMILSALCAASLIAHADTKLNLEPISEKYKPQEAHKLMAGVYVDEICKGSADADTCDYAVRSMYGVMLDVNVPVLISVPRQQIDPGTPADSERHSANGSPLNEAGVGICKSKSDTPTKRKVCIRGVFNMYMKMVAFPDRLPSFPLNVTN